MYHRHSRTSRYLYSDLKVVLSPLDNSFYDLLLLVLNDLFQVFNKLKKLAMLLVFIFEDEVGCFVRISGNKAHNLSDGFEHCFFNNCRFMLTKPFIKSITIELFPVLFEHCQLLVEFVMAATINKPFTKDQTLLAPHHIINSFSYGMWWKPHSWSCSFMFLQKWMKQVR